VIGGSSGIGLATARRARSEGADVVFTGGPYCARLAHIDFAQARRNVDAVFWLPLHIARI
jgi:NAD(P)-dependent dehydrogenase (short-subunit alcohol dehydrogenase family)